MYPQALPTGSLWYLTRDEDRRFRRILTQTLMLSVLAGIVTTYLRIPETVVDIQTEAALRRVRLLPEPPGNVVETTPLPATREEVASSTAPRPTDPAAASPATTARERAGQKGILTMRQTLKNLLARESGADTHEDGIGRGPRIAGIGSEPVELTANLTRLSDATRAGVPDRAILGEGGLPDNTGTGQLHGDLEPERAGGGPNNFSGTGNIRSQEEIQEILDRHKAAIYNIYNRELLVDPGLQGKLVLSITIASAGNVTYCSVVDSDLASSALEQQLVALVRDIDFGSKPDAPEVSTRIPVEFFPR